MTTNTNFLEYTYPIIMQSAIYFEEELKVYYGILVEVKYILCTLLRIVLRGL